MRPITWVSTFAVAMLVAAAWPASSAAATRDCSGYPEPRLFLESQAWWKDPGSDHVRHVHSGTCFPYRQVLDGQVTFDVVSALHEYPGEMLRFVRIQAASDQGGVRTLKTVEPRHVCLANDCSFTTPVTVDVSGLPAGTYEFRIHSERRPGIVSAPWSLATNGWLACVKSCDGVTPQAVDSWQTEGRGYYRTRSGSIKGYVNARFREALPWRPLDGMTEARAGTWCPTVETLRGAGDEPVDATFVTIDPRFHAVPEDRGRVLIDTPGTYRGPVCIDTTTLSDGDHTLMIRSHHGGAEGDLWGVLAVPFRVDNGQPPDPGGETPPPDDPPPSEEPPTSEPPAATGVVVTRPDAGARLYGWQRFDATVPDGTVRVDYLLDGDVLVSDATPSSGFDEPWDTQTVANGEHEVVARAHAGDGTTRESAPVRFSVQNP